MWLDGANSPSRALNVEDAWLDFWKGAIIADGSVLVRQGKPGNVFDVVRLDLRTGTSHVIAEFGKQVSARNGTWIDRAVPGNWAEVTGTGSCLNLRSRPNATAPSLACYADGVLLDVAAGESTADWLRVTGPDGQVGWVSAEFVLR